MFIVGFNGPPESGKDTVAEYLADHMDRQGVTLPVRMESLSLPLRKIAYAMVDWQGELDGENYAQFKSTHFGLLGKDGRQLMIDVSEKFLKPTYGIEVMAKLLLERNEGFHGVLLIRDMGFQIEVNPLEKAVGPGNICIVQVHRNGKTFENDSREWVRASWDSRNMAIANISNLNHLATEAGRVYGRLVNQMGWVL